MTFRSMRMLPVDALVHEHGFTAMPLFWLTLMCLVRHLEILVGVALSELMPSLVRRRPWHRETLPRLTIFDQSSMCHPYLFLSSSMCNYQHSYRYPRDSFIYLWIVNMILSLSRYEVVSPPIRQSTRGWISQWKFRVRSRRSLGQNRRW